MADIVEFTNKRKQDMALDRGFFDYLLAQVKEILDKVDKNEEDLTPYWDKLHTVTKGLHVMSYEYKKYYDLKRSINESNS